ncbi:dual serine/threonine and tyrosine protein kinase-like [Saccoglossus kowalevskii]|uniref:Dual serine/threonine and tyrosine protein kinase n=1 Tax=Saccoglossus kowalevskii TaxID=10224 RepID=A0ABM0GX83_SACKO|nr:PREDICTED: dual serine/threonine and tyrosine protein kinase-like [Saccoglossus kowalevskii]
MAARGASQGAAIDSTITGDSGDILKSSCAAYKRDSEEILTAQSETLRCYESMERSLSRKLQQAMRDDGVKLLSRRHRKIIGRVERKPSLIFIGQTNSGKSSLINLLLGGTYVSAKQTPATARLVKLNYGKKQQVSVISRDGSVIDTKRIVNKTIPRKWIELDDKSRRDPKILGSYLAAEVDNDFLASGVEVVDSPGLKENEELDRLVLNELKSIVPFVVYVLDGQNQLTNQDREDINKVQEITKEIFFVVTKVDKDDDDDDDDDWSEADVVYEKKSRAYNSLVREGYLPDGVSMEDCNRFHGISNWRVKEYRRGNHAGRSQFIHDYNKFQVCLCDFIRSSLDVIVRAACTILVSSHTSCIDFFIQRATKSKEQHQQFVRKLDECRERENKLYSRISAKIKHKKTEVTDDISTSIRKAKPEILKDAANRTFTDIEIPTTGVVTKDQIIKECQEQMENFVKSKIVTNIAATLSRTFQANDGILEDILLVAKELETNQGDHDISEILKHCTMSSYDVENAVRLEKTTWKSKMKKATRKTLSIMKHPFDSARGRIHVNQQWKKATAEDILGKVNIDMIAETVVSQATNHLNACHKDFEIAINRLDDILRLSSRTSEKERHIIRDIAPRIARLEFDTYSILDKRMYGLPKLGKLIGRGSQSDVYECECYANGAQAYAVKEVDMTRQINDMDNFALEVHYTRKISNDDRMLPLIASIKHDNYVYLVTPRMKWDLMKALPHYKQLKDRLSIAVEIAKGIRFLHSCGLVHRDIKAENILLDEDSEVKIADFGLSKAEGLITDSIVGAPIAMAPELIRGEQYNKLVDVYAFGILLWFICEGSGVNPKKYANVKGGYDLMLFCKDGLRPEYVKSFDKKCWNLMESCWDEDPENRPDFDTIIKELKEIRKKCR